MPSNRIGQPVTGEDFFDRESEQARIWDDLERDHLLLLAPRRVGKTSLMLRLRETAAERGFRAVYCSVAAAENEISFVRVLADAVSQEAGESGVWQRLVESPLGRFFRRIRKVGVATGSIELEPSELAEWSPLLEALVNRLEEEEDRWLLLIDELPVFVLSLMRLDPSGDRARRFLTLFRTLRQGFDSRGDLRWLLAGSIGLDTVAAKLSMGDTINDLHLVDLGAFSFDTADRLLCELSAAHNLPLPDETRAHFLKRIGWPIPFHLQILFSSLRRHCGERRCPPTVEAVDAAFQDLLSPRKRAYFDSWRQRLEPELGNPDGGYAIDLLNAVAQDEAGATRATLSQVLAIELRDSRARAEKLRYLLDVLEGDGYLIETQGRYRFRSPLLREFWIHRVVP